jgi:hypothetical protein
MVKLNIKNYYRFFNLNRNLFFMFFILVMVQIYLILNTGLTADEPNYNLNSFNELKFILGIEKIPLGTDVLHGNTFQIFGSLISCLTNPNSCTALFLELSDKNLFWSLYDTFLIGVRLVLIPLNLLGQISLLLAAILISKQRTIPLAVTPLVGIYPIWLSHSAFNFSDFIPLVGFSMLIYVLTGLYLIDNYSKSKKVRLALNPWFVMAPFFIIAGSRFPLIYIAIIAFFITFIPNSRDYFIRVNWRSTIFPLIVYFTFFTITNLRFMTDLPNSIKMSLGLSTNFEVGSGSKVFVFSQFFDTLNTPSYYIAFNNFARVPLVYIFLTLGFFYFSRNFLPLSNKKSHFFIASLLSISVLPLVIALVLNSPTYDTARHFYFIHSVILFLSIATFLHIMRLLINHGIKHRILLTGFGLFLFVFLIADELSLNSKAYIYRNEIIRLFGVNVIESDYWASNRNELRNFVGSDSKPILLESQWYQSNVRLYFEDYTFVQNTDSAVAISSATKQPFIFRSSIPLNFAKFEETHQNCTIQNTSSSRLVLQEIVDGRIYLC